MLGFTAFKYNVRRNWCWNLGRRVTSASTDTPWFSEVDPNFAIRSISLSPAGYFYTWCCSDSNSGHYARRQGKIENCILRYGCIGMYYAKHVDDERRTAFDITPFLQRPALRFDDGRVMPFAPRALEGWLGATGAYYRLFDISASKGSSVRERFTRFNGFLVERHVVANAEAAHSAVSSTVWVPRVIPEQVEETSAGESRTPDVVLDYGRDLVVIEVTSGRPTAQSVVDADPDAIRKDIAKLLEVKITQLGDRINDIREGTLTLPDVQIANVSRIWPIVVNSEGLLQTPSLWGYLRDETGVLAALDQTGVQPLTLLDVEDIERIMGLTAEGHQLIAILESKTQAGWQEREFASWFEVEGSAFGSGESTLINDASQALFDELVRILIGDQTLDEYEAKVGALRQTK